MKFLRPVLPKKPLIDKQAKLLTKEIQDYLFKDIVEVFENREDVIMNSKSALLKAIRDRRIVFQDGEVSGNFNTTLFKELLRYNGIFDSRRKTFKMLSFPQDIQMAFAISDIEYQKVANQLELALNRVEEKIVTFDIPLSTAVDIGSIVEDIDKQFINKIAKKIPQVPTIEPEYTEGVYNILNDRYINNVKLSIKGFSQEDIPKFRADMLQAFEKGVRPEEVSKVLQKHLNRSADKALFLAKQEINLITSNYNEGRYLDADVRRYKWSTSQDSRVRDDHEDLHGKIFTWDDPPVVNQATGKRAHPRQDFGCRCVAIPILD